MLTLSLPCGCRVPIGRPAVLYALAPPPMAPPTPLTVPIAAWLGTWSRPSDGPGRVALALSVLLLAVALVPRGPRLLLSLFDLASVADLTRRRPFLIVGSFAAAFLSLGCIAFYLRGGPRAPDAATYWLEGHALSHGALSWAIPGPTASFRAAGLFFRVPDRVSGVYPPGYPLLLAMGFLVGAPMLIGPLLAAALVVATWLLAHEVLAGAAVDDARPGIRGGMGNFWPQGGERAEAVARLAAGLSILSAALRYHTADALPDGAAALAVASSLACGLRARRTGDARFFAAAGLAVGLLVASSPASAIAVGAMVAVLATGSGSSRRARALLWICVAALPGVLLLVASNRAATGHALQFPPTNLAAADGVAAGTSPAVVSIVRVAADHLRDVVNLEPLALVALAPLIGETRLRAASLVALVIVGQVLVRVVVGVHSMPAGAEARPLVCIAPLEQVLIALGIARSFPRAFAAAAVSTLALSLGGFAVHASHVLQAVAGHDIGRPRFEPDIVREANVTQGVLFFDDDEGYELAHDPAVSASHGIESVRMRGDDHDRLLFDSLGHPPVHQYVTAGAHSSLTGWVPPNAGSETWRFEAESDWPPVALGGEVADALIAASDCASGGRVLRVSPGGPGASVMIDLPVPRGTVPPEKRVWIVTPRVLEQGGRGQGAVALVTEPGSTPLAEWTWSDSDAQSSCVDLPAKPVELGGDHARAWLVVRAAGGSIQYDRTTLSPR
jgi:hypothetical protein